jgi:glycerol-3-phosphate dehydrogenase
LEERWKEMKPVLWGDGLREAEFLYWIYQGLFGISAIEADKKTGKKTKKIKGDIKGDKEDKKKIKEIKRGNKK